MNWKELLTSEIEYTYKVTEGLMDLVDDKALGWKPCAENNWMTTGQLLMHFGTGCGYAFRGFVIGDWSLPEEIKIEELSPDEKLPPAEKLPTVRSVSEAKELLAKDKQLALEMLSKCDEGKLVCVMDRG